MKINQINKNRGFTIIEVMIVLAIAGLILAVILLAVPALQRSQRNNARTSDATHLAGIVSDWVSNHGGALPTAATPIKTSGSCSGGDLCLASEHWSQLTGAPTVASVVGDQTTPVAGATKTTAVIDVNMSCDATSNAITSQNGAFAIVWQNETSGTSNAVQVCIAG